MKFCELDVGWEREKWRRPRLCPNGLIVYIEFAFPRDGAGLRRGLASRAGVWFWTCYTCVACQPSTRWG